MLLYNDYHFFCHISIRLKYEELLKQCNLDHERALEENQKQINVLKERLIQQVSDVTFNGNIL